MRLAHLADLHLGFRQFQRVTASGMNQREADVAQAFTRAVDAIVTARPDLTVVAGDVFHTPRPTPAATVHALAQFARLTRVAPVVIAAGNHDSPRTSENGHILHALQAVGCHVVTGAPAWVPVGDAAVFCVPDTGVPQPVTYQPDPRTRYNVALVHGEVRGLIPGAPERPSDIDPAVWANRWDYVALGHYHVQQEIAPRVWYAGSLEYTSSNPWGEIDGAPKGWLLVDLARGTVMPQPLGNVRTFVQLPTLAAGGMEPDAVLDAIGAQFDALGDLSSAVVRQVVTDCELSTRRAFDGATLRALRKRAWHVQLDFTAHVRAGTRTPRAQVTRQTLAEMLADALTARAAASGLDVERMLSVGGSYLSRAAERELAPGVVVAMPPEEAA